MNAAKDVFRLYLIASIIFNCGCALTSSARYELAQTFRAHSAWREFDTGLLFSKYSADYARGWKAGFRSILVGGDGRPPVVPPRRYWNPTLFCGCNVAKQQDWLKGFGAGAVAAKCHSGQHYIRPLFNACCERSCPQVFDYSGPITPSPMQQIQTTPVEESLEPGDVSACTIRLLGIEPIPATEKAQENPWAIAIPTDSELPAKNMTRELSPKPSFKNSLGDER